MITTDITIDAQFIWNTTFGVVVVVVVVVADVVIVVVGFV